MMLLLLKFTGASLYVCWATRIMFGGDSSLTDTATADCEFIIGKG